MLGCCLGVRYHKLLCSVSEEFFQIMKDAARKDPTNLHNTERPRLCVVSFVVQFVTWASTCALHRTCSLFI